MEWGAEPDVDIRVRIGECGPLDDPLVNYHDVTRWVRAQGITITRGRSSEFSDFQAGTCTFTLLNNDRRFDPSLTGVALGLPGGVGDTASTPDHSSFAVVDLDVRMRLSMDDWTPGGFGSFLVGQWPNSPGNNGWLFGMSPTGFLQLNWTTDGSTTITRTASSATGFTDGSTHWIRATLDVNNDAAGHDVTFRVSDDGATWTQIGSTITTAGVTSIFNSTDDLTVAKVLPFAGQVRRVQVRGAIDGHRVTDSDFSAQDPGTTSFADSIGRTWTVNGNATIRFDDDASPHAAILKPRRRVFVDATYQATTYNLFSGWLEGWPGSWPGKTTGSVDIVAHDYLGVLAGDEMQISPTQFILGDPIQGRLGTGRLGGVLPQQLSGERIRALLSFAGLSQILVLTEFLGQESIAEGLTHVIPVQVTGNLLGMINDVVAAEAGFFFAPVAGGLVFRDRHSRFQHSRMSTTQATFTDGQYSDLTVAFDVTQVHNDARFVRQTVDDELIVDLGATVSDGGEGVPLGVVAVERSTPDPEVQSVRDVASIQANGRRVHTETVPVVSDAEALGRAEFWVRRYATAKQRPSAIVVKPRRNMPALFPKAAGLELLDRVQIERTPLGIPPTETWTGLAEQVTHRITNDTWETTIGVSLLDADEGAGFLILGDATLGRLGVGTLAY